MADRDAQFERRISLAHEPPFPLGAALACPPTRELIAGGQTVILEPRVMQVLVALGRSPNAIVTRDQLIMQCWHGTVVGENAIQRTISRLRQVGAALGNLFEIDTINKVGYRLRIASPGQTAAQAPVPQATTPADTTAQPLPPPAAPVVSRRVLLGATVGGAGVLALGGGYGLLRALGKADAQTADDLLIQSGQALRRDTPEGDARQADALAAPP